MEIHSIQGLYKDTVLKLKALYADEEARAIADRLFEHYFNLTPAKRVLAAAYAAEAVKIKLLSEGLTLLNNNVPLQYVTGTAYFMDLEFKVNPSVLIPRPETEQLVSMILKTFPLTEPGNKLQITDIGTGSGCIAVALKHNLPEAQVTAVDISQEALDAAAANAVKHNVSVQFVKADILDKAQWDALPECDLIVSNPPYVTFSEKKLMHRNVLDHEPHIALFVPDDDPLVFYRSIAGFAKAKLKKNGVLWFEINEQFGDKTIEMLANEGFTNSIIFSDFHKKERFLQTTFEISSLNKQ